MMKTEWTLTKITFSLTTIKMILNLFCLIFHQLFFRGKCKEIGLFRCFSCFITREITCINELCFMISITFLTILFHMVYGLIFASEEADGMDQKDVLVSLIYHLCFYLFLLHSVGTLYKELFRSTNSPFFPFSLGFPRSRYRVDYFQIY